MDVERGFAAVNGTRLYYEVAGSGTPVVLVHGFTLDVRMWDDQFLLLAEHYRVVRYDLRGFGQSATPTTDPYVACDDLRALLDFLGIDAAAVVGLSMGGGVAADFALTYPDRTKALVLIDAALGGHRWSAEWTDAQRAIGRGAREGGVAVGRERWLAHDLFAPARAQPAVGPRIDRMIADYSGWHWVNRSPERNLENSVLEQLDTLVAPTLVIVGERDLPDFHAIAARLQQGLPQARVVTIPGVGHMANMEAPDEVNAQILGFLGDVL